MASEIKTDLISPEVHKAKMDEMLASYFDGAGISKSEMHQKMFKDVTQYRYNYNPHINGYFYIHMVPGSWTKEYSKIPADFRKLDNTNLFSDFQNQCGMHAYDIDIPNLNIEYETYSSRNRTLNYATRINLAGDFSIKFMEDANVTNFRYQTAWLQYIEALKKGYIATDSAYEMGAPDIKIPYYNNCWVVLFDRMGRGIRGLIKILGVSPINFPAKDVLGDRSQGNIGMTNCTYKCNDMVFDFFDGNNNTGQKGSDLFKEFSADMGMSASDYAKNNTGETLGAINGPAYPTFEQFALAQSLKEQSEFLAEVAEDDLFIAEANILNGDLPDGDILSTLDQKQRSGDIQYSNDNGVVSYTIGGKPMTDEEISAFQRSYVQRELEEYDPETYDRRDKKIFEKNVRDMDITDPDVLADIATLKVITDGEPYVDLAGSTKANTTWNERTFELDQMMSENITYPSTAEEFETSSHNKAIDSETGYAEGVISQKEKEILLAAGEEKGSYSDLTEKEKNDIISNSRYEAKLIGANSTRTEEPPELPEEYLAILDKIESSVTTSEPTNLNIPKEDQQDIKNDVNDALTEDIIVRTNIEDESSYSDKPIDPDTGYAKDILTDTEKNSLIAIANIKGTTVQDMSSDEKNEIIGTIRADKRIENASNSLLEDTSVASKMPGGANKANIEIASDYKDVARDNNTPDNEKIVLENGKLAMDGVILSDSQAKEYTRKVILTKVDAETVRDKDVVLTEDSRLKKIDRYKGYLVSAAAAGDILTQKEIVKVIVDLENT